MSVVVCTNLVYTIAVRSNITFSAEKDDIRRAREEAQRQRTTLHELFRDWLKRLGGAEDRARDYRELMDRLSYVRPGRKFTREEMNERR